MPKVIPGLAAQILQTAARHFETKGFEGTDMKGLASELGISVGTLYNYHPSKPGLFLAVCLLWKDELSQKILCRLDQDDGPETKLRAALLMLYENMEAYTGIWREFLGAGGMFQPGSPLGEQFKRDNDAVSLRIQGLFAQAWKGRPGAAPLVNDPEGRLSRMMIGSIMQLVMNGLQDRDGNRRFVEAWLDFLLPSSLPSSCEVRQDHR